MDERLKRALDNVLATAPVTEEDKTQYNETSNLRNILIDKLGLPKEYKMTVAEEKEWAKNLPMAMAIGQIPGPSFGKIRNVIAESQTVKNVAPAIQQAAKRLQNIETQKNTADFIKNVVKPNVAKEEAELAKTFAPEVDELTKLRLRKNVDANIAQRELDAFQEAAKSQAKAAGSDIEKTIADNTLPNISNADIVSLLEKLSKVGIK